LNIKKVLIFSGGGGPPPPPPPPAYELDNFQDLDVSGSDDRAALFASLNKGEGVTSGLKKVTADMQTHKNPSIRAGSTVPAKQAPTADSGPKAPSAAKPPKFVLEGKKWIVEYQVGQKSLVIDKTEMNQVVYMFGCKDSVINIKGKLNSIVVDSCIKTAVVFESLVSSVEFVNARDCQMQVCSALELRLRVKNCNLICCSVLIRVGDGQSPNYCN